MYPLLIVFSFFLLGSCQSDQKLYATPFAGLDVISNPDRLSSQVSYCQNLVWNPTSNQIWFTADEASPNLQLAEFDPNAGPGSNHSFWLWKKSPVDKGKAAPFVSLSISPTGNSFTGSAFPASGSYQGLTLQTLQNPGFAASYLTLEGYEFFGITYGKATTTGTLVYVAGWVNVNAKTPADSKKGFVVARGIVPTTPGPMTIKPVDITGPLLEHGCYDIFTEQLKPQVYQIDKYLMVILPGRCQTIIRFELPSEDTFPFGSIKPQIFTPGEFGTNYIAATGYDAVTGNVFFATRTYNQPDTDVNFINGKGANLIVGASIKMATEESSVMLIPGAQGNKSYVYVVSPLQGLITQLLVDVSQGVLNPTGYANIPSELNKASAFLYIKDFIYFSTYEPSCKLARLPIGNFCPYFCGDNAFCNAGLCTCQPNYSPNWVGNRLNGCDLTIIHEEIVKEQQIVGTAAVMGVLFVITTIVAFFGWRAWYAGRSSPQAAALVHEYNRPL